MTVSLWCDHSGTRCSVVVFLGRRRFPIAANELCQPESPLTTNRHFPMIPAPPGLFNQTLPIPACLRDLTPTFRQTERHRASWMKLRFLTRTWSDVFRCP